MTTSAFAIDVTSSIINANADKSFQAGAVPGYMQLEGGDAFPNTNPAAFPTGGLSTDGWKTWADSSNGTNVRLWNPSTTNRWTRATNEFFDTSWGGGDAAGDANGGVIVVKTQGWDYIGSSTNLDESGNRTWTVSASNAASTVNDVHAAGAFNWSVDSGAIRNFEAAAQVTSQVFDPTAKYTLSVRVGRLHDDGFNTGATVLPGVDTIHGTGDDVTTGLSTRFANDAAVLYNGYFVNLIAGGVQGSNSSFGGWTYGRETTSTDAAYMKVLGTESSLSLAANSWGTSTQTYLPGSLTATEVTNLTGKKLMIRLAANEAPDHKNTTAVAFDDVTLTKIVAGDANEDDAVNFSDFNILANNYNGPSTGQTWATADFNGNGDTDFTDFNLLINKYGQPVTASAALPSEEIFAMAVLPGLAQLLVGLDGSLTIEGGNVNLNGYSITSASGLLNAGGSAAPFQFFLSNTANEVAAGAFSPVNVDGLLSLSATANTNILTQQELVFEYGTSAGTFNGAVVYAPEPGSLALMGMGVLWLTGIRRRKRASASRPLP